MLLKDNGLKNDDFDMIAAEDMAQIEQYGYQAHTPELWQVILTEEVGELSKAILEGNIKAAEKEAIQVATVALKMAVMFRKERE